MAVSISRFLKRAITSKHGHYHSWKTYASNISSQKLQPSRSQSGSSNTQPPPETGAEPVRLPEDAPAAKDTDSWQESLDKNLPGIPSPVYIGNSRKGGQTSGTETTKVTTLSNGLRVATEAKFGQFCTVGVCIDSGSRYEVAHPSGVSHFLEKLAFGATEKFNSRDEILKSLEKYGGICDCQSTRDTFLYAASVDRRGLDATIEILGDVVLRPTITDEEIEVSKAAISFEIEDANLNPMQEAFTVEAIHAAAFANNTVGLPKIVPTTNIQSMTRATLMNYLSNYHSPERMVIAGVGVDHDELVEITQKHFVDTKPVWNKSDKTSQVDNSVAQYTGGIITTEKDLSSTSLGLAEGQMFPELAHLVIGLEGVSHQHEDFIGFCVLNMLMGGGGSFSAGGPGKGMYTRLYTHVLNRHHWMYSATAFNHAYNDTGLFCISASAPPEQLTETTQVILREFARLTAKNDIQAEELNRAKKQLQSMLLMNLESRPVIFEDVARQVLAQGQRERPEHYIEKISKITGEDIQRIADKMLTSKPSVAAVGTLKDLPAYKDIELALLDRSGKMSSSSGKQMFRLFR